MKKVQPNQKFATMKEMTRSPGGKLQTTKIVGEKGSAQVKKGKIK